MMFSTSLAVLVLSGSVGADAGVQPIWQADYKAAAALSAKEHKPLAVFITKGGKADLSDEAARVLKANYVVVAIDSTDAQGKKLADAFEMNVGVVVSDRTGDKQALRIEGQTAPRDLAQTLERLAEPNRVAVTTEVYGATGTSTSGYTPTATGSAGVPSYYTPAPTCTSCQGGNSGGFSRRR